MRRVLIVDAANLVGSKPDGWWRDRAGAARRLCTALREADLPYERIIIVLEGQAKGGAEPGAVQDASNLHIVHAPGEGDDEIIAQTIGAVTDGFHVEVATSDRGLRARVTSVGAIPTSVSALRQAVGY